MASSEDAASSECNRAAWSSTYAARTVCRSETVMKPLPLRSIQEKMAVANRSAPSSAAAAVSGSEFSDRRHAAIAAAKMARQNLPFDGATQCFEVYLPSPAGRGVGMFGGEGVSVCQIAVSEMHAKRLSMKISLMISISDIDIDIIDIDENERSHAHRPPSTMTSLLMQARGGASGEVVPLAVSERLLAQYFNVTFAFLFRGAKAGPADLADAFAKVLDSFQVLAGRLVLSDDGTLAIACNNQGVPLLHEEQAGPAPSFGSPIGAEHFDIVRDSVPTADGAADAPMRVKVTDFDDGQVLAISINHGLCDARGLGAFMVAWAEAYRSGSLSKRAVSNDRVGSFPPAPAMGAPPLSPPEEVPPEHPWRSLRHLPEQAPSVKRAPMASPVLLSHVKTAAQCAALKEQCKAAAGGGGAAQRLSTNDAVCAELVAALGMEGEQVPISMLLDFRPLVGAETCLGNMWTSLEFLVTNSLSAAADIRAAMPVAQSAEFVRWQVGQGANASWPAVLLMNSWAKAFDLSSLGFASEAADMMAGAPFLQQRAAMMAPVGISYCIALPQSDGGLKVVGVVPDAAAQRLHAAGSGRVTTVAV